MSVGCVASLWGLGIAFAGFYLFMRYVETKEKAKSEVTTSTITSIVCIIIIGGLIGIVGLFLAIFDSTHIFYLPR